MLISFLALGTPVPLPAQVSDLNEDLLICERKEDLRGRNRLLRKLSATRVTLNFDEASVKDLVNYLTHAAGGNINFIISSRTLKADEMPNVTLRLKSVSLANAMAIIQVKTGLVFTYKAGIVFLKPKEEVKVFAYLRMYDVRAAVMQVPHFRAPKLGLRPPGEEVVEEEEETQGTTSGLDADKLVDLIRSNVAKDSWDQDGISIDSLKGVLLVRQTVRGHREVRKLLVQLGAIPATTRILVPGARKRLKARQPGPAGKKPAGKKPAGKKPSEKVPARKKS